MKRIMCPFVIACLMCSVVFGKITVSEIEPTIFFSKNVNAPTLQQLYRIHISNDTGNESKVAIRFAVESRVVFECNEIINPGKNIIEANLAEITHPTLLKCDLLDGAGQIIDSKTVSVEPQKKWKIYYASVSHQDMGFIDYYQHIARNVRQAGIELAMKYCDQTETWDEASKFRWTIETDEPVLNFIKQADANTIQKLRERIIQGRIQLGGVHNTFNTEKAGYETFARAFYTPNRYVVDMLEIPPTDTGIINDVVGFSRALPLFTKEAGLKYFFHGRNGYPNCIVEASKEPVFYWIGSDQDGKNMTLFRTDEYYSSNRIRDWSQKGIEGLVKKHASRPDWQYDCILSPDSEDFSIPTLTYAENIHAWNAKWEYPKIICATMGMFFRDAAAQADHKKIKCFDKDAPNAWADQDSTDAELSAIARRVDCNIPTAEKFSTIAMALAGGGYPERDLWQAYNRMLMYHEHTNGASSGLNPRYYETERVMHKTLVWESADYCTRAMENALVKLTSQIETRNENTIVVFNPLNWKRTDTVVVSGIESEKVDSIRDISRNQKIAFDKCDSGKIRFVAQDIPSLGYKCFSIKNKAKVGSQEKSAVSNNNLLENAYYRIVFDKQTGAIASIIDKELGQELVDQNSNFKFGEYLHFTYIIGLQNWYRSICTVLERQDSKIASQMSSHIKAFGAEGIVLKTTLYNTLKRIDFSLELNKQHNGCTLTWNNYNSKREAVFCAMPLNVPGFTINHELAGAVVEPVKNQFEGSSTDYYAIQHFSDVSNTNYGVTLATVDCGLIEYGNPRPAIWRVPWLWPRRAPAYESIMKKPERSHLFLYLMNNMFFTNICIDQPGPKRFEWSIRSHKGDWKSGGAAQYGWDTASPLIAKVIAKRQSGSLPSDEYSFFSVDQKNVACSTIKLAEANGSGFILRFFELEGKATTVTAKLNFLQTISSASQVTLIEDGNMPLQLTGKNSFKFELSGHGIKTVRVVSKNIEPFQNIDLNAKAVSDKQMRLTWQNTNKNVSHFKIYRSSDPECKQVYQNYLDVTADPTYLDQPTINSGGWPNNNVEPNHTYYYRISQIDRNNNESIASKPVKAQTLSSMSQHSAPAQVQGVYAVHVSPIGKVDDDFINVDADFINIWFYTNGEKDVDFYLVYRATYSEFEPNSANYLGQVDVRSELTGVTVNVNALKFPAREYNRQMFADQTAFPNVTYYYKVCAKDSFGSCGEFSRPVSCRIDRIERSLLTIVPDERTRSNEGCFIESAQVSIVSKDSRGTIHFTIDGNEPTLESQKYIKPFTITESANIRAAQFINGRSVPVWKAVAALKRGPVALAQSVYSKLYPASKGIDGNGDSNSAWVSSQYGGGSKKDPCDVWFEVDFPGAVEISGIQIIGDQRDVIPEQRNFQIYALKDGSWEKIADVNNNCLTSGTKNDHTVKFARIENIKAIKLFVPACDLPKSDNPQVDGIVRVGELMLTLPDGSLGVFE